MIYNLPSGKILEIPAEKPPLIIGKVIAVTPKTVTIAPLTHYDRNFYKKAKKL